MPTLTGQPTPANCDVGNGRRPSLACLRPWLPRTAPGSAAGSDGSELEWFECLPPPNIHAAQQVHHQALRGRYVVKNDKEPDKTHQEYVARSGMLSRPGVRIALRQPRVVYQWDVSRPPTATLEALQLRAARVGYLGTSDSPVRVRVATQAPSGCPEQVFVPDERGDAPISVAQSGDIKTLDRMYDQWCERGAAVVRLQFPSLRHDVSYRSPDRATRLPVTAHFQMLVTSTPVVEFTDWRSGCRRSPMGQLAAKRGMPPILSVVSSEGALMLLLLPGMTTSGVRSQPIRDGGLAHPVVGQRLSRPFTSGAVPLICQK